MGFSNGVGLAEHEVRSLLLPSLSKMKRPQLYQCSRPWDLGTTQGLFADHFLQSKATRSVDPA